MARFAGHETYLRVAKEDSFGSLGLTPTWIDIYGRGDDYYDVRATWERTTLPTNVGMGIGLIHIRGLKQIRGALRTWAMPGQVALIDWATKVTNNDLDSFSAEFYDGNRYVRHTGLKVERLTLTTGAGVEAQPLALEFALVGKDQEFPTAFTEPAMPTQRPYIYREGTLTINGLVNTTVEEYSITVENTLVAGRGPDETIPWLRWTGRRTTCQFTLPYADTSLLDQFEAGAEIDFKAEYTHAVAAKTLTVDLKTRCVLTDAAPRRPLRDVGRLTVQLEALAVDAQSFELSVSEL